MSEVHDVIRLVSQALRARNDLMVKLKGLWYVHIPADVAYPVARYWLVSATTGDPWVGRYGTGVIAIDIYAETLGEDIAICNIIDDVLHRRKLTDGFTSAWIRRDEGWSHDYEPDERGGRGLWTTTAQYFYEVVPS